MPSSLSLWKFPLPSLKTSLKVCNNFWWWKKSSWSLTWVSIPENFLLDWIPRWTQNLRKKVVWGSLNFIYRKKRWVHSTSIVSSESKVVCEVISDAILLVDIIPFRNFITIHKTSLLRKCELPHWSRQHVRIGSQFGSTTKNLLALPTIGWYLASSAGNFKLTNDIE